MKKVLFLIPLIVLLMGFTVKAESYQDVLDYLNSEEIYINSNSNAAGYIQSQVNAANNYYNNSFGIAYVIGGSGGNRAICLGLVPKNYIANMTYSGGYWKYNNNNTYNTQCNIYYCTASGTSNNIGNYWTGNNNNGINITMTPISKYGKYDFIPPIDWDNPLYSISIETPTFEVTYRNILYDQIDVPLNVNMTVDQQSELYCEVMAEYTLPNSLQYRYSSNSFEASQYTRILKTIVSAEQQVKARTLSASGLYAILKNKYAECLQELPLSSVSIRFPSDFEAQQILDARQIYDELRQVCTVGGTAIKIYIRYFAIENQTQFVVGSWRIWNSTNPKIFGVELPSWYKPYIPASGNQGTNTTTDTDPDVVVIPAGGQTPTGQYYDPSINITVGSNVPNYPDYPTIASYNLDNMLVDTMNNVRGLSTFFGEFVSFLTTSFSFFPSWIWAIIGVGFSISIVVMFLKIL